MKALVHAICSLVLSLALLYLVFKDQSVKEFAVLLGRVDIDGVVLYCLIAVLALILRALRYRAVAQGILDKAGVPSSGRFMILTAVRNALVDALPARLGELAFFYVMSSYGISLLNSAIVFGLTLALDIALLLVIVFFAVISLPLFFSDLPVVSSSLAPSSLIALGILSAVILFSLAKLDSIFTLLARLPRAIQLKPCPAIFKRVLAFAEDKLLLIARDFALIRERGLFLRLLLLTLALRAAKYCSLYVLLIAVIAQWGIAWQRVSFPIALLAFIGAEATASLPASGFLGFGAYEISWNLVFSLSGMKIPSIMSVILAVHIITQVVGYSIGLLGLGAFLFDKIRNRQGD